MIRISGINLVLTSVITADGVDLKGEEATTVTGKTLQKPGGWWLVGVDVFHQLHCLVNLSPEKKTFRLLVDSLVKNFIRQGLRPNYYTPQDPEPIHSIHLGEYLQYRFYQ